MKKTLCRLFFLLCLSYCVIGHSNLTVITVATYRAPTMHYLEDSCQKWNIPLIVLGDGETYYSHKFKLDKVREYLDTLPDDDILLFVDAFDVAIIRPPEEILNTFLSTNKPFVISAEKGCWPYGQFRHLYPIQNVPFPYINSGGYIGYVWAIKSVLDHIFEIHALDPCYEPCATSYGNDDDQGLFTRNYFKNPVTVQIPPPSSGV